MLSSTHLWFSLSASTQIDSIPFKLQCEDYKLLTDPKRKASYATSSYSKRKCDRSGGAETSPDWQSPGWYRISPNIGTKISTSPTKENHCGTGATGWINGGSTPGLGQMIDAEACFSWAGDNCYRKINVRIRNCKDYFLYFLPDILDCYASRDVSGNYPTRI